MGREIRRVPLNWEHPKDGGRYKPLYDRDYEIEAREWLTNCLAWEAGTHKDSAEHKAENPYYWDWSGNPPDREYYRPAWTSDNPPIGYQVYETVSEGTPTSPVFETQEELVQWLKSQGYSEIAARNFAADGWVPSFVISNNRMYDGIEAAEILKKP